ncbi:MAG: NADH-quinone oxidoreductase subunit NuoG, partial [Pseudomonadota bacterium]
MARVFIDGQQYDATEGDNLLQACLSQGLDLPYFCWHPAMGSVGACRQCAVVAYRDEEDTQGRLIMACMTPVTDGARISIQAAHARDFRANVIEWLMENHPHDCPVCEEGGDCHLQDMTVMTGHTARQYRGNKRTYENQYLGPFINHEMNRCITCYRCVRFYRDYAGGTDLAAFGSRSRMYFGRAEPGVLENEFSGNLVEVCPTGVFTDKPFSKVYSRKWDLQSAPSLCTGCSVGCNTFASERYGTLKRIHNRYHPEVNRYFLCDRGRFGMSYVNSPERIRRVGVRIRPGVFAPQVPDAALTQAAEILREGGVLGIGSPRASLEDNWALRKLVGEDNFYSGFGAAEHHSMAAAARLGEFRAPSVSAMEAADAVLVLGEDLLNTAPRIALAIRQAAGNRAREMADEAAIPQWQDAGVRGHAQHERSPVFVASVLPTRLDDVAAGTCTLAPAALVRCGRAIAAALTTGDLDPTELGDAERVFATAAALALREARQPLIVTGTSLGEPALVETAGAIARTLRETGRAASLAICGSEANSFGMRQLPQLDQHVEDALQAVVDGRARTLLVLQNDLFRRADAGLVTAALEAAKHVIVLDCLDTPTATAAE